MDSSLACFCALSLALVGAEKTYVGNNQEWDQIRWVLSAVLLFAAHNTWKQQSPSFTPHKASEDDEDVAVVNDDGKEAPLLPTVAISADDIPAFFRNLHKMHVDDRPFHAVRELEQLRNTQPHQFKSPHSPSVEAMIERIDHQRQEIFRLTNMLQQESNWKFRMRHRNSDVFISTADSRDFKVVGECPGSDMFSIISLIYETDLYKNWLPGVSQSSRWKLSKLEQRLYLRLPVPFPMKDREVLLKGYGDVTKGGVMIYVQSVDSKEAERRFKVKPGAVRCDVQFAGFLIKQLPNDTVQITIICRLDIKMPILPNSMIDYGAKFALAELLACIRDVTKGMRDKPQDEKYQPWLQRQHGEDAQVYNELRARIAEDL